MRGWVGDIEKATLENDTFRTVLFTGEHHQLTVMCIPPGEDIGLEAHDHNDQFLRIEQGRARVELGASKDALDETYDVEDDWAIIVPAKTWHNVVNTGDVRAQALLALRAARAPGRHRPPDEGGGRSGGARA